jgi:hypothetical protein
MADEFEEHVEPSGSYFKDKRTGHSWGSDAVVKELQAHAQAQEYFGA